MSAPVIPPSGYLTRPEASKSFNRSQRALERELDVALRMHNQDALAHWKLATKDGLIREGIDVSLDEVKQLVTDGMAPVWCISESYLEVTYGKKGSPKPKKPQDNQPRDSDTFGTPARPSSGDHGESKPLADDVEFLKERIRVLEEEKRLEIERNEKREAKLFEQLAVKDKQISAWDEVSQGIAKALATGAITPSLLPSTQHAGSQIEKDDGDKATDKEVLNAEVVEDASEKTVNVQPAKARSPKKRAPHSTAKRRTKKKASKKPAAAKKPRTAAQTKVTKKTQAAKEPQKKNKENKTSRQKPKGFLRFFR